MGQDLGDVFAMEESVSETLMIGGSVVGSSVVGDGVGGSLSVADVST